MVNYTEIAKGESYERMKKRYNINDIEDLYLAIGTGSLIASSYISRLKEENLPEKKTTIEDINKEIEEQEIKNHNKARQENSYGVTVKGERNLMVRFARCCSPVPGDDIMGYITKGRGVSVHRTDCINMEALLKNEPDKVVDVSWGNAKGASYIAEIRVKADDRMGILTDVMQVITESKLEVNALNANSGKGNDAAITIKVKIDSIEQLRELMKKIRHIKGVTDVYRMNS